MILSQLNFKHLQYFYLFAREGPWPGRPRAFIPSVIEQEVGKQFKVQVNGRVKDRSCSINSPRLVSNTAIQRICAAARHDIVGVVVHY